ncbi:MAG: SRPBCC family protein [Flavobacteriales bacterium]|nr:SRPBCC family protein [Flavobacteriales bacterium]
MSEVKVKKSINVSANKAWSKLSAFSGIEEYSPIASSVVEGQGAGAKRVCTMPYGAKINEVMNSVDDVNMHFQYAITDGPFPITNYVSDVKVRSLDPNNCEVSWGCSFNSNAEVEGAMKETFEGFYNVIIDDLEKVIKEVQ